MMSRTSIFVLLGLCVVAGLLIAGCTEASSPAQTPATTVQTTSAPAPQVSQAGMANPASVNCGKIGGTTDIKKGPDGEYGMCSFPNGTTCEEWALFRGEGCKQANLTASK
jgi:putative hemolysin